MGVLGDMSFKENDPLFVKIERFKTLVKEQEDEKKNAVEDMFGKTSLKSVKDIVTKVCKDEEGILDFVEDRIKLELERNKEYRDFVIMEKNGPDHWRQLGNPETFDNAKKEYERLEKDNPGSIYSILRVENLESEVCEWIEKRDFHIEINSDYIMIGIKGKYFRIPMSEEVDLTHIILQSVKAMRGI